MSVTYAFKAYVTFSEAQGKIEIEVNVNLNEKIIVRKEGNVLIVGLKRHTYVKGNGTLNVLRKRSGYHYFLSVDQLHYSHIVSLTVLIFFIALSVYQTILKGLIRFHNTKS